jgi:hypothetical protein
LGALVAVSCGAAIGTHLPDATINEIRALWGRYCQFAQPAVRRRYAAKLACLGVPVQIARAIRPSLQFEALFPVFVAEFARAAEHRLLVLDGVRGLVLSHLGTEFTVNHEAMMRAMERAQPRFLGSS